MNLEPCNQIHVHGVVSLLYYICTCRKVKTMEDSDGNIHLKNLSLHPATNEEEGWSWGGQRPAGMSCVVLDVLSCDIFHHYSFELALSWRYKQNDC